MNSQHLDALNVMENWFGGSMNRADAFVASIHPSIFRDLVDMGLARKRFLGWEITYLGREKLIDNEIFEFSDTRSY